MSATMRPTLQTVPESLPADHVTNASGTTTTTTTAPTETKSHSHTNTSLLKNKSSSTREALRLIALGLF
ncbi:hypothetical protein Bhyg_05361 [Pseudolycoriella hygida]|uniref:Uncharacterized protein n=1 Tax=Pseudolycoriella hygida TaxID=35572 RepID=A0A9Q0NGZ9_9DIPT|nr:hypothetical protein Bhyg_05361 [Pseudolycoriella hygida]